MFSFQFNFNKIFKVIAIAFFIAGFFAISSKTFAATGILKQINFQGKVVNTNGTNVTNGNYSFLFCLYTTASPVTACTAAANNDAVWRESKTLTVTDGIFRTSLGDTTALPGSVDFNTDNIYLGTNFNSDGQMTPLVRFTAVPYAFNALKVAGLTVTDTTGTFTLAAAKTLTVNNTLTLAGTDATTLTFQGTDTYVGRATSDTLTNKTVGSTGLTFSGAAIDITTASNEDLTLTQNGSGNTIITSDFNSGVLIGSSSNIQAPLSVTGGIGSNALAIFNQTNSGDVLAASTSGTTKFRIANNGDVILSAAINLGGTNGTSAQCLLGGATAAWGSCSAGAGSNWDIVNGVITPKLTSTLDFLLGSNATASAKFGFINVLAGTPTATISGNIALDAAGVIQTTKNQTLTIGGNSTGNIVLTPNNGSSGTVSVNGALTATTYNGNTITTGTGTLTLAAAKTLTANNTLTFSGTDGSTLNVGGGGTLGTGAYATIANYATLASPTFTGTVTIPTPFTLGATSVTATGTQLNYLNAATGTTGTTSTNVVFSTSPTLTTPILGAATATSVGFGTNNLSLIGTTISTSGNNADLTLAPNGTGDLIHTLGDAGQFAINATPTTDVAGQDSFKLTLNPTITGSTQVLRGLVISQSDNANTGVYDSLAFIENLKTPETTTNGLFIQQNAASGTLSNALHITNTAGTLTSAITIDGTAPGSFILDTGSLDISGAGAITGATGITSATGNVAITAGDLTLNGVTRISNAGVGTFITGTVLGSQTFTTNNIADSGALTIKSGGTSALTLDTSGAAAINIANTNANSIALGNATTNPTLTLTGTGLTTLGGGLTFSGTSARTVTGPNTGVGGALVLTTTGNLSGLTFNTATGSSGNSGTITIQTGGTTTSGTSGSITVDVGAGVTANGTITIGGTNASALTIGRAGVTTTINGTLTANTLSSSGVTITGGSINGTTVGATTPSTGAFTTLSSTGATTIGNNTATVVIDGTNFDVSAAGTVTLAASQSYTGAGAITVSSGGTSGLTFDSASGDITVVANDGLTFAATTLGNNGSRNVTINSGTGGTTATLIVKLDTSGTVVTTDTTTLNNAVGVALNTTTAGVAVRVAINGVVTATADNAITAGDYIGLGTTTAGRAKSLGTTYPSTAGVQVIGRALGTQATPGSTFLLMLNGLDNNVAAGGGGGVSFASGTPDNTTTSNNLIHLQKSGVNRFVVGNSGGLTINGTDSSVVRTLTSEFATGTLSNLTNSNDQLELSDGTAGNGTITTASQPVTSAAIGAGGHSISRSDGKYVVVRGGGTGLDVYDSVAGTFTNNATVLSAAAGAGALTLPRTTDQYLVVHGGALGSTTLLTVRNATDGITAAAGPAFSAGTATTGTVAWKRPDSRFVVGLGGAGTTQIYNPILNTFVAGPAATAGTWGAGSLALPRPDGQVLVVQGGATATSQLYNPNSGAGDIGVFAAGPALPTGCEINGAGSIAIRKPDGKYIVISKINSAAIYDPVANTWAQNGTSCTTPLAGKGPTVALADGAHAIPMQDGKYLVIIGGASTVANIYDPSTDTFTAHATAVTAGGAGRHSIMRVNGTWQMINGGGTGTNNFDTSLPMTGSYVSDDISTTSLNVSSTIKWTAALEGTYIGRDAATNTAFSVIQVLVRTAVNSGGCTTPLNSATDREILKSGDLIRSASTDNCIRVTVKFNRPIPKKLVEERGTWTGNNTTSRRPDYFTPTLFDIVVDNSTVLRRTNFDFTNPNAGVAAPQNEPSGPLLGGAESTLRAEATADRLYLPYGRLTPLTLLGGGAGSSGYYPGVISGAHPNLSQTTTDGTIVIARDDKQFLIISAGAANASLYDPATSTFTAQAGAGNIPTAAMVIGTGAHAIKRPDGKFLIIEGGGGTDTNIYDPRAASGSRFVAGPATTVAVGAGSYSILNADGTFTILHGGAALSTSIYNPVRNTMIVGPATPVAINCGSWAIPRPQYNHYLVGFGAAAAATGVTTSSIYDANNKIFSATAAAPTLSVAVECGSFAVQRPDGMWWYPAGDALLTSAVYNPAVNRTVAGPAVLATGRGAHAIPRADGTFLIVHGNAGTTTSIYVPWGGTNSADAGFIGSLITTSSPATQTAVGAGALSFQRPDGKWVLIVGGATAAATTNLVDAGWYVDGQYLSEQVQVPALAAGSTLEWKQTPDNFVKMEVRTAASQAALGTTAYTSVGRSGQSIGNAGGETWVQVQINFRRDFPTFCGNLDSVYASTGGMAYCNRYIHLPTIFEYKLNNGMDLVNLQNNGLSMFRVTSSGNVYTGNGGTFLAGGADLAENYTSSDSLEKGEVVIIDKSGSHGVKRSQGQYQSDVLGVVSTAPGFVAGSYTDDSYPIALVGRVPVKVSTENGEINAGDFLTSASIPGYAMKATKVGRILGKALEDLQDGKECPAFGMGNLAQTKCGEVMMFVNLTNYLGSPVELVMEEHQSSVLGVQLSDDDLSAGLSTSQLTTKIEVADNRQQKTDNSLTKQEQILVFLKQLKEERENNTSQYNSEVFTDRISAVNEIITPHVITELLTAKKIKADSIEGLEILTNQISKIKDQIVAVATSSADLSSSEVLFESGKFTLDLTVLGKLTSDGGLIIAGPAQFKGETAFEKLVTFVSNVIFRGKVTFEEVPTFNKDTAGSAIITKDTDQVVIVFDKEYERMPFVTVGITLDTASKNFTDKTVEEQTQAQEELENNLLSYDLKYFVTKRDSKGFVIKLNKKAPLDVPFSWHAIAVKDSMVFKSKPPVIEPTSVPSPIAEPTIEPSISPSEEASPSAQ